MIYLIRHGKDDENYLGGHSNVHLTHEGINNVCKARNYIIDNNLHINKINTSDILRAKETTNIINTKLSLPVIETRLLREQDKGLLNGLEITYVKERYKEWLNLKDINKKYPEGESLKDLYKRILSNIDILLKEDNTLLVTHRGVINMLYYILNNIELDYNKERFNVTHSSIHEYNPKLKKIRRIY